MSCLWSLLRRHTKKSLARRPSICAQPRLLLLEDRTVPAGVSLTTIGTAYTQNFNTLPTSGSATWTNDSTIEGWFYARTGTGTTVDAGDGSSATGALYSFGTGTATDRALGSVGSGNAAAGNFFWGVRLQNNTGTTITQLDVSYTGEQWRNGGAGAAQTVSFSYIVGSPTVTGSLAEFQSAGVAVSSLDFISPVATGGAAALDGNAAANRTAVTFSITGLSIPNGTEVMLRWSDPDHTGNDHGLAIDDFSVTPRAPEINLQGNSVSIADGDTTPTLTDHTDFGTAGVTTGTVVRTFTIQNTGGAALNLTGAAPLVAISGANAGDFSVTTAPTSPVTPAGSTTFQITFDPSAGGLRTATVTIPNNDADEGTYDFAIQGTGDNTLPTVTSFNDNDADNVVGVNTTMTYTVTFSEDIDSTTVTAADFNNAGTAAITIGTITETAPGVFSVQVTPTSGGTIILRIPTGSVISDVVGNNLVVPVQDNDTVTVDATGPTVTISAPSQAATFTGPITYTITYADPNFGTSTLSLADITLNTTGSATGTVSVSAGSGTTRTVTISNITGVGTLGISLAAGTARDVFNNLAAAAGPSQTFNVEALPILAVGNTRGTVRILNANTGAQIASVRPLDNGSIQYLGLVEVAVADFNGDDIPDLVVSAADPLGTNGLTAAKAGKVFLYDGVALAKGGLTLLHTFTPFANHSGPDGNTGAYTNGLNIAVGDIDNDGDPDLVAGTRGQIGGPNGTVIGKREFGRMVVVSTGFAADGRFDTTIGSIITPFGTGYQKGVVVATGNLDGVGGDEIGVTRGGPVAKTLAPELQTIKLKAFKFSGGGLAEIALSGNLGNPLTPFESLDIRRDGRVAFVDTNGDGTDELVFSALDRTTSATQVRIAAFSVDPVTGLAAAVSTGSGPNGSYLVGGTVVDHATATSTPILGGGETLALITESSTSQIRYLDPLNGLAAAPGYTITLVTGGVALSGF